MARIEETAPAVTPLIPWLGETEANLITLVNEGEDRYDELIGQLDELILMLDPNQVAPRSQRPNLVASEHEATLAQCAPAVGSVIHAMEQGMREGVSEIGARIRQLRYLINGDGPAISD